MEWKKRRVEEMEGGRRNDGRGMEEGLVYCFYLPSIYEV